MSGARPTIIEFVTDPQLLGLSISPAQGTLLKAIYGLPLDSGERDLWQRCTGRSTYPGAPFYEVTCIAGARSGKDSRLAIPIALYEATFGGADERLAKGERGIVPIVAQDEKATRVAFSYARDYALGSPLLRKLVEEARERELRFTNRIWLTCFACTAKSLRAWSIPSAIMDEVAFYRLEGALDADQEIQTAIRRGGVGFAYQRLVKISTPSIKGGVLWDDFSKYYGKDVQDVLVWKAPTTLMNPTITEARLAREQRVDPVRFAREYLGEFGADGETFLPGAWIEAAVVEGRQELPPVAGRHYVAAVDPSGGAADAFTLAVLHLEAEGTRFVLDCLRAWKGSRAHKVQLAAVVGEIAGVLQCYGLTRVVGDKYAGEWPRQEFQRAGVLYVPGELDKSHCYQELEPVLAQQAIELLDNPTLVRELRLLEKRYKLGGKTPTIDHPKGGHDDHANVLALAVATLAPARNPAAGGTQESFARAEGGERSAARPEDERPTGFFGSRVGTSILSRRRLSDDERAALVVSELQTGRRPRGSNRFWRP
jgi:hypothetical protein